jgi:hypothetical protein
LLLLTLSFSFLLLLFLSSCRLLLPHFLLGKNLIKIADTKAFAALKHALGLLPDLNHKIGLDIFVDETLVKGGFMIAAKTL